MLVVSRLVEHNKLIICHDVFASADGMHDNLVQCQPLLEIGLAVLHVHPEDLEARGPSDGLQSCHEGAKSGGISEGRHSSGTRRSVLSVVLLLALELCIVMLLVVLKSHF